MCNINYIGNTKIVYGAFSDKMKAFFEDLKIWSLFRVDSRINSDNSQHISKGGLKAQCTT